MAAQHAARKKQIEVTTMDRTSSEVSTEDNEVAQSMVGGAMPVFARDE